MLKEYESRECLGLWFFTTGLDLVYDEMGAVGAPFHKSQSDDLVIDGHQRKIQYEVLS